MRSHKMWVKKVYVSIDTKIDAKKVWGVRGSGAPHFLARDRLFREAV